MDKGLYNECATYQQGYIDAVKDMNEKNEKVITTALKLAVSNKLTALQLVAWIKANLFR